jgi:hypothetical protein
LLKTWRKALLAFLTGALVAGAVAGAPTAAFADAPPGWYCDDVTDICYEIREQPGTDPVSNPDPETGFTPGPVECTWPNFADGTNVVVPCSSGEGYWSNKKHCYIKLTTPQPGIPAGEDASGAWYTCNPPAESCGLLECYIITYWSDTPPPGINTLTPGQAALRLISSFQLEGITVGFAPNPNIPGSKSYVGVPIWMWVNNPTPLSYGPYSQTSTLGGVTITATAQVTSILWNMGDGNTVACGSPGTPFLPAYGPVESPTCGYRYSTTSDDQPGGRYNVTATSQWTVTWTGGGETGTVPLSSTSNSTVEINELQAVNVK